MPYRRKDSPVWWVSYTDASGQRVRRATGTTNRREAEALEAKWKLEAFREHKWDEPPTRTFDELMVPYLKTAFAERRQGQARLRSIACHLRKAFQGREINRLQNQDIRAYIRQRKSEGAAASTINKEIGMLSAAINYARREWGWEIVNPAQGCRQKEPEGRVRWLNREEFSKLVQAAEVEPRAPHLTDYLRLAVHTGCRRGELLGLEWRRVDIKEGLIYLEAKHTKAGKRRSVPLNSEARAAIIQRARFHAQYCPTSPWVFCHKDGARIGDIKRSFTTACRRAEIRDFRLHDDLRHTCAAWLVSAEVPLTAVRDLLGHSTIKMTERYAHLAPESLRSAVQLLESDKSRFGHAGNSPAFGSLLSN